MSEPGSPGPAVDVGTIVLAGAGNMGGALLHGWLAVGVQPRRISVVEPHPSEAVMALCGEGGPVLNPFSLALADIVVLAVKPQTLAEAAPGLAAAVGPETLVMSIVAGKTLDDLASRFPGARSIVRAMPNTPAAIGRGVTGVIAGTELSERQAAAVDRLLGAVGGVEWLADEASIDVVTGLSGSGPAYVFYLTECLSAAGVAQGLAPGLALRLARATVAGAGELMRLRPDTLPAELRRNVTSPGGTTAAALAILMGPGGLEPLMERAVAAARRRAEELSG